MNNALGLVEVIGRAAAVVAVDTILKAANVELIGIEPSKGDGMYAIKIEGDVGAVKASVDSIKSHQELINKIYATKVIARPALGIDKLVYNSSTIGYKNKAKEAVLEVKEEIVKEEIVKEEIVKEEVNKEEAKEIKEEIKEEVKEEVKVVLEDGKEEIQIKKVVEVQEVAEEQAAVEEVQTEDIVDLNKIIAVTPETKMKTKEVCNLCNDPKCKRKRGEPKSLCISHNSKAT